MSKNALNHRGTFGFTIVSIPYGDDGILRTVARFDCEKCRATFDRKITPGAPLNREACAQDARNRGWIADAWKKTGTRCPACAKAKTINDPDSELKKVVHMAVPAQPVQTVQPIRDPTQDQRLRIRGLLDKHFDDALGMYLDEMSDARLAELSGVPRVIVERIREAAYGPLKVSPELTKFKAEVAELKERMGKLTTELTALSSKIEKHLAGLAA